MNSLAELRARCVRDVDAGLLPGVQYAVAHRGKLLAIEAFGDVEADTPHVAFSASKIAMAAVAWRVLGMRGVPADAPLVEFLPELRGDPWRERLTVVHLLTHTAGLARAELPRDEWGSRALRSSTYRGWRPATEPGAVVEYHPTAAHWLLADVLAAITGRDHRALVADLAEHLGLHRLDLGTASRSVARIVPVGEPAAPDALAVAFGDRVPAQVPEADLLALDRPELRAHGLPGGGLTTTAADLALLLQALLHDPDRYWRPDLLRAGTREVLADAVDAATGLPASRSLGLVIAGSGGLAARRGFGHGASPAAFGHPGAGGQVAWADPASGLSFVHLTGGLDRDVLRLGRRMTAVSTLAAAVLG